MYLYGFGRSMLPDYVAHRVKMLAFWARILLTQFFFHFFPFCFAFHCALWPVSSTTSYDIFSIRCIAVLLLAAWKWTTDMARHTFYTIFFRILFTPQPNAEFPYAENCNE